MGTKGVDGATRILFIGKLIAFAFVLFMMLPKVSVDNLMAFAFRLCFRSLRHLSSLPLWLPHHHRVA